jgi:hypothetical protein
MTKTLRWLIIFLLAFGVMGSHPSMAKKCYPNCATDYSAAEYAKTGSILGEWAEQFQEWATEFEWLEKIISWFTTILNTIKDFWDELANKLDIKSAVIHLDAALDFSSKSAIHQSEVMASQSIASNAEAAATIMKKTEGEASSVAACNHVTAAQGPAALFPFALYCENVVTKGTEALFIAPGSDGNGPQYARFAWEMTCPSQDTNNPRRFDYATGDSLRGFPAECLAPDIDFAGGDMTARMTAGDSIPLQMPPIVDQQVTMPDGSTQTLQVPQPDQNLLKDTGEPQTNAFNQEAYRGQQAFMAAWKGCIRSMGPRPSPVTGSAMTSSQGVSATGNWFHFSAQQSAYIAQCARMMCKHTRPYCGQKSGDASFDGICANSSAACDAASALGADLPFSCSMPMSLYQAEYAAHAGCLGSEALKGSVAGTTRPGAIAAITAKCQRSMMAWQAKVAAEQKAFVKAQGELAEVQRLFSESRVSPVVQ